MITLTPAILLKEQLLSVGILRKHTDYLLNAQVNGLISERPFLGDSMYLDALVALLSWHRFDGQGVLLAGGISVPQEDVLKIIDRIHHYERPEISLSISYQGQESGSSSGKTESLYVELTASPSKTHSVDVPAGFVIKQVHLNGVVLSRNDYTYSGNTFTYTGEETLVTDDWFLLYFEK